MARPKRKRIVGELPKHNLFSPSLVRKNKNNLIEMSIDEYETIRLIDSQDMTQEECANQMQVARTTVQSIYNTARKKIADAIVNGKVLSIKGGQYQLCHENICGGGQGMGRGLGRGMGQGRGMGRGMGLNNKCEHNNITQTINFENLKEKGEEIVKIAIPVNENKEETTVAKVLGRAPYFLIYDTKTKKKEIIENVAANNPSGAGIKAAQIIADQNVGAVLAPSCGKNAAEVFYEAKIIVYNAKGSSLQENIEAFSNDQLTILTEIHAGHHGKK